MEKYKTLPELVDTLRRTAAELERWAVMLGGNSVPPAVVEATTPAAARKTRKPLSTATRKRMAAAQKKRWKDIKAAAKNSR